MTSFAFRISKPYEEVKEQLIELIGLCSHVAIYQHEADDEIKRTHIHGLLMGCDRKEDTIRNKYFKGIYEKADYQLSSTYKDSKGVKQPVDIDYIVYMSKGSLLPSEVKGFSSETIEDKKSQWKNPIVMLKVEDGKFVQDKKEPKKKTKYELLTIMRERYKKLSDYQKTNDYYECGIDIIAEVLIENQEVIGEYKVKDYFDSLLMYEAQGTWKRRIMMKLKPRE